MFNFKLILHFVLFCFFFLLFFLVFCCFGFFFAFVCFVFVFVLVFFVFFVCLFVCLFLFVFCLYLRLFVYVICICVCLLIVVSKTYYVVICLAFLRLVYPMLSISLDCPFVIAPRCSQTCIYKTSFTLYNSMDKPPITIRIKNNNDLCNYFMWFLLSVWIYPPHHYDVVVYIYRLPLVAV